MNVKQGSMKGSSKTIRFYRKTIIIQRLEGKAAEDLEEFADELARLETCFPGGNMAGGFSNRIQSPMSTLAARHTSSA
ncbi:unnamed protein product [Nippostrongylus brasiliensis]|uniref:Gag protein n=1 Tax=Nippostrongylus brasiliensis TaxID=27835 RepID=A0A0N4XDH0_NIPBR|nr:unnamed protein product [Nippostrongylus brasiliensis]